MPSTTRRLALASATAALGIAAAAVLAGCAPSAQPAASPSSSATAGAGASSDPVPSATPTPTDPPTPVGLTCDQVLTADQVYAFNPNYGADPGYAPKDGTLEKKIADWQGVSCAWLNQTSGDVIQVAVAKPPASAMEGLKNAAITAAKPVPTYGVPPTVEGYFKPGDAGQVQVFRGSYWIVAESPAFFEPGDAAPLMESVLGNVPAS